MVNNPARCYYGVQKNKIYCSNNIAVRGRFATLLLLMRVRVPTLYYVFGGKEKTRGKKKRRFLHAVWRKIIQMRTGMVYYYYYYYYEIRLQFVQYLSLVLRTRSVCIRDLCRL